MRKFIKKLVGKLTKKPVGKPLEQPKDEGHLIGNFSGDDGLCLVREYKKKDNDHINEGGVSENGLNNL